MHPQNQIDSLCPKCSSGDTQSFQMAYNAGTTSGNIKMGTFSHGDGFGVAGGKLNSQTLLARTVNPPSPPSTGAEIALMIVTSVILGGVSFFLFNIFFSSGIATLVSWAVTIGIGFALYFKYFKGQIASKKKMHSSAHFRWLQSWLCLRCGNSWIPQKGLSTPTATSPSQPFQTDYAQPHTS